MALLKRYPYFSFFLIMLFFGALEAGLTPLLTYLGEEKLALATVLYYFTQALAVIAPFLMMGAAIYAARAFGFSKALPFVLIYLGVRVLMQFPLAIYEYAASLTDPYLFILLVYLFTAILNVLFFFFLVLLGYLLFTKSPMPHEERFFGAKGADTRALWLATFVIAAQKLVLFVISFIEHLKGKLWIFEAKDAADALFSIVFIALCALLSYAVGRFAMRAFFEKAE